MTREDFEKMGFNLELPGMEEVLRSKGIPVRFQQMDKDQVEIFIRLNFMFNEDECKSITDDPEWNQEFLVQVAKKRMDLFPNVFHPAILPLAIMVLGVNNPGKINIFIARCLEWYLEYGKQITQDIISMQIFPFGFFDDETGSTIINECMKPKTSMFSEIY